MTWRSAVTPPEAEERFSRPVLVFGEDRMYVANYDAKEASWVLSVDGSYGFIYLARVSHWLELPGGP